MRSQAENPNPCKGPPLTIMQVFSIIELALIQDYCCTASCSECVKLDATSISGWRQKPAWWRMSGSPARELVRSQGFWRGIFSFGVIGSCISLKNHQPLQFCSLRKAGGLSVLGAVPWGSDICTSLENLPLPVQHFVIQPPRSFPARWQVWC